jgi:methionyl-tRNA synthetase
LKGEALWPRAVPADAEAPAKAPKSSEARTRKQDRSARVDETKNTTPAPAAAPAPVAAAAPAAPAAPAPAAAAAGDKISIDDFMKIDMRVAKVLAAEKVPNSKKLMKLSIDVGTEQRTLVAGIAEAYEPEQLVGRTIAMVFNLKPAKLMGIESNGMVLAASPEGGGAMLVNAEGASPGTRVR